MSKYGFGSDLDDLIRALCQLRDADPELAYLDKIADQLIGVYEESGRVLVAGNGGSAAAAQHFVTEIRCDFELKRKGRPGVALTTDTSALTAWGNDHGFDSVFARLVEADGRRGDALVVISTSGNSENLVQAVRTAREKGILVIGLLGKDGGRLHEVCDESVVVGSYSTARIQEVHDFLIHCLCKALDLAFVRMDANGL